MFGKTQQLTVPLCFETNIPPPEYLLTLAVASFYLRILRAPISTCCVSESNGAATGGRGGASGAKCSRQKYSSLPLLRIPSALPFPPLFRFIMHIKASSSPFVNSCVLCISINEHMYDKPFMSLYILAYTLSLPFSSLKRCLNNETRVLIPQPIIFIPRCHLSDRFHSDIYEISPLSGPALISPNPSTSSLLPVYPFPSG